MTIDEIIDGLEVYTIGKLKKARVHISVEELQKFIDAIKSLKQEPCDNVILKDIFCMGCEYREQQPCEDEYIKGFENCRQAVLNTISELNVISFYEAQEDSKECYYEIRQAVENLPPVNPQPQIGYWIEEIIKYGRKVFCSECGCSPPFEYVSDGDVYSASGYGTINKTKFCPSCGAKMVDPRRKGVNKCIKIEKSKEELPKL